jgi:hypothetical protein
MRRLSGAMRKHSLPPLTNPAEPDSVDSYEYLLRMRMDRVKASAVAGTGTGGRSCSV